jgi:uncharacterized membrane protein
VSNKRRIIHAISFELSALFLFVVVFSPLFDHSATELGIIGIAFSLLTVVLLYFYNHLFDKALLKRKGSMEKSSTARIVHALLFEASLLIIFLPAIVWWLGISIIDALILEAAAVTLMVIYTYIFHWVVENYVYKTVR